MRPSRRFPLPALVIAALVVAGCSGGDSDSAPTTTAAATTTTSQDSTTTTATTVPATTTTYPSVPAPDALGPYGVGRRTVTITDAARNRTLTVDYWYPIAPGTTGPKSRYELTPALGYDSDVAIADAPVSPDRPFPFVVYSHGSGGLRYVSSFLTEALASHGFVVAAPDHAGNTAVDTLAGTSVSPDQTQFDRPKDVSYVITDALERDAPASGDWLSGAIDTAKIGVLGHSLGGFTALAVAGGFAGPLGPIVPDFRVKTVVGMAPYTRPLQPGKHAQGVAVPTLLIGGTKDTTTPIDADIDPLVSQIGAVPFVRVILEGAGHQSFTDICRYVDVVASVPGTAQAIIDAVNGFAKEGCAPDLMPIVTAHALTERYAISFLKVHLAKERAYQQYLDPGTQPAGATLIPPS